jgi:hypothetical protein
MDGLVPMLSCVRINTDIRYCSIFLSLLIYLQLGRSLFLYRTPVLEPSRVGLRLNTSRRIQLLFFYDFFLKCMIWFMYKGQQYCRCGSVKLEIVKLGMFLQKIFSRGRDLTFDIYIWPLHDNINHKFKHIFKLHRPRVQIPAGSRNLYHAKYWFRD